jgi:iron complex outermembrane receptor protein
MAAAASALLLLLSLPSLQAQSTPAAKPAAEPNVTVLEAFSVTGSNILMNASEADKGRLPIEFISAEKFQFTSGERLGDFLRLQPFIAGSYLSAGNINAGGYTSVSIHGVGRNYTLQLVDGRRMSQEDTVPDISGFRPRRSRRPTC